MMPELNPKLQTQRFVRMPFYVDAVQITSENMEQVAKWCNGDVRTSSKPDRDLQNLEEGGNGYVPEKYIKVRVVRPANDRQSMAFAGDWILYAGTGYKVYTDRAFKKSFDAVDGSTEPLHVARDARSGEFVTRSYAEENPETTVVETHRDASAT
jgi:hypothetical protein